MLAVDSTSLFSSSWLIDMIHIIYCIPRYIHRTMLHCSVYRAISPFQSAQIENTESVQVRTRQAPLQYTKMSARAINAYIRRNPQLHLVFPVHTTLGSGSIVGHLPVPSNVMSYESAPIDPQYEGEHLENSGCGNAEESSSSDSEMDSEDDLNGVDVFSDSDESINEEEEPSIEKASESVEGKHNF